MKKKMMVVGGAGFIGSNVTEVLIARGDEVHVVDNLCAGKREQVHKDAQFHEVDIRTFQDLLPIMQGVDTVFHFAALPRVQYSIDNPQESHEVNVTGTLNILTAAKECGVRRVVFSASSATYGEQEEMPLVETMPNQPLSPYALHKLVGEEYCKLYSVIYGLETVSLRYFNVFGKNQDPEGPYALVIGKFLKLKKEGKPLLITGDGEQSRDFVAVADVVRANILASEKASVGKGEVINIGGGRACSINKLAELLGGPVEYIPARLEPKHTLADISKAKELLDWEPEVTLEEGVKELLKEC
jgi:nucleoside-diphosphate-sugar epimerase